MRYESFVIQESFNPALNFRVEESRQQNFHESTAQRHKGQSGSMALAVKCDFMKGPRKRKLLFVWDPWTLCQELHEEGDSKMQQLWWERSPRQGMQETKRWRQWQWVQLWLYQTRNTGQLLPVEDSRHASRQWLHRSHSDEHRSVPGLCAHSLSGQKSNGEASRVVGRSCVRISIPSNKGVFQCELRNFLCVPDYSSNLLSFARWTYWGHSFTFEKRNSCMKLQKGTQVKLTQEKNWFYLPCSVLEFKMSSNNVKLESARKWHRRLGHLNHTDVVRNAPETVGELDNVCNVCALAQITKTPVPRVAETQAEEKPGGCSDVMGHFRVESLSGFRFCIAFADQYTKFVFVDLLKAKSEALASLKKFDLSVVTPKKLRQDNAKEFLSEQFKTYWLNAGILQEMTIPETPQQNGLA